MLVYEKKVIKERGFAYSSCLFPVKIHHDLSFYEIPPNWNENKNKMRKPTDSLLCMMFIKGIVNVNNTRSLHAFIACVKISIVFCFMCP